MALASQIEVAARPERNPVVDHEWGRQEHVLGGVGITYGQAEEEEREAARRHARRLANSHGCILPSLLRIALSGGVLGRVALPLAALVIACGCPHPRHAADVADARLLLAALGLIGAEEAPAERAS